MLRTAWEHGVDCLVLCDTNGGTMPEEISSIIRTVRERLPHALLGIHAHNDCELAVANSLAAVNSGAIQVQGTVNGIGERCGNANLCSVIPNLQVKMKGFFLPQRRFPDAAQIHCRLLSRKYPIWRLSGGSPS